MNLTAALATLVLLHPNGIHARPDPDRGNLRRNTRESSGPPGPSNANPKAKGQLLARGNFGKIDTSNDASAQAGAKSILENLPGASNKDKFVPKGRPMTPVGSNSKHIRFTQQIHGYDVEGASVVVHTDEDGNVIGMNGELVSEASVPPGPTIGAGQAIKAALDQSRVPSEEHKNCSQPKLTVVRGLDDGLAHLSWTCTVRYDTTGEDGYLKPFKDQIYATATGETPKLLHVAPKIYGAMVMQTENCNQSTRRCSLVEPGGDLSQTLATGDDAIDMAHNYAMATYDYYFDRFGRDSIDNNGMTLKSRVHYDRNYNNAFWDGSQMTYGDGDGTTFSPLSQDADVVAHELTHGVTERSSNLVYSYESGALNEAMSDIFGALVEHELGEALWKVWLIGEDIYTPNGPSNDALRNMCNPKAAGDYDFYPQRYVGSEDNGGVHWNSGIANLAMCLLVKGGMHPRAGSDGVPSIDVPHIGGADGKESQAAFDEAGRIFYYANTACMTSSSNFASARYCTALFGENPDLGTNYTANIHKAWDAVGVPNDNTPPPAPSPPMDFEMDVVTDTENEGSFPSQSGATGSKQQYRLTISAGSRVTCSTVGANGDADLYIRFGAEAEANTGSTVNECGSYSADSNEACTTSYAVGQTDVYALVDAWTGYSGLTVTCKEYMGACPRCGNNEVCCSDTCATSGNPNSRGCVAGF